MYYNVLRYVTWAFEKARVVTTFLKKKYSKSYYTILIEHFLCDDVEGKSNACGMVFILPL